MKCELEYCIFNKEFKCIVHEPKINSLGMCDACIVISLEKNFLKNEKEKQLLEIKNRWGENAEDNKK